VRNPLRRRSAVDISPAAKVVSYLLLLFWTFVVLFPLYWLAITSFKLPIQVDAGPFYLPFIDYRPTLDAWHYILVDIARDTIRPYVNSVVVALASTCLAVLVGAMAAYALVRIRFRVKIAAVASALGRRCSQTMAVTTGGIVSTIGARIALSSGTLSRPMTMNAASVDNDSAA